MDITSCIRTKSVSTAPQNGLVVLVSRFTHHISIPRYHHPKALTPYIPGKMLACSYAAWCFIGGAIFATWGMARVARRTPNVRFRLGSYCKRIRQTHFYAAIFCTFSHCPNLLLLQPETQSPAVLSLPTFLPLEHSNGIMHQGEHSHTTIQ